MHAIKKTSHMAGFFMALIHRPVTGDGSEQEAELLHAFDFTAGNRQRGAGGVMTDFTGDGRR